MEVARVIADFLGRSIAKGTSVPSSVTADDDRFQVWATPIATAKMRRKASTRCAQDIDLFGSTAVIRAFATCQKPMPGTKRRT